MRLGISRSLELDLSGLHEPLLGGSVDIVEILREIFGAIALEIEVEQAILFARPRKRLARPPPYRRHLAGERFAV